MAEQLSQPRPPRVLGGVGSRGTRRLQAAGLAVEAALLQGVGECVQGALQGHRGVTALGTCLGSGERIQALGGCCRQVPPMDLRGFPAVLSSGKKEWALSLGMEGRSVLASTVGTGAIRVGTEMWQPSPSGSTSAIAWWGSHAPSPVGTVSIPGSPTDPRMSLQLWGLLCRAEPWDPREFGCCQSPVAASALGMLSAKLHQPKASCSPWEASVPHCQQCLLWRNAVIFLLLYLLIPSPSSHCIHGRPEQNVSKLLVFSSGISAAFPPANHYSCASSRAGRQMAGVLSLNKLFK